MRLPITAATATAILLAAGTPPAHAETVENLSLMADKATGEQSGIAMAQDQASQGRYLDALSTLERVLIANPQSRYAQILHAIYLCRIDDRLGGQVEIGKLKPKDFAKADLANARAECGMAENR